MNNYNPFRLKKGFTLIELLIGMAIMGLILGGVFNFWSHAVRSQMHNAEMAANMQAGRMIIMSTNDEVRNAVTIASPTIGNPSSTLIYRLASDTANRSISIGTGSDANTLLINKGGTVTRLGQGRVTALTFSIDSTNAKKVNLSVTLHNASLANAPTEIVNTAVVMLN